MYLAPKRKGWKDKCFMADCLINSTDAEKRFRVKEKLDLATRTLMETLGQVATEEQHGWDRGMGIGAET